ncbi:MAG TPA: lasso peptide biosynthesis B2 protein [Pyrinomonadaceae bacterium]|nr:lasso peptide biosynthesis B2 protein [Pyrinomonadaceae bacterium]
MGRLAQEALGGLRLAGRAAGFAAREPGSALLALRMAAWVAAISLGVKVLPLPRVLKLATPLRRRRTRLDAAGVQARTARLLDALLATDVWCFTPTCWKRAPVLYRFLALQGVETRVLFGVRKGGDGLLDGHAWIEAGGEPVLEKTAPDFSVTFSHPA